MGNIPETKVLRPPAGLDANALQICFSSDCLHCSLGVGVPGLEQEGSNGRDRLRSDSGAGPCFSVAPEETV